MPLSRPKSRRRFRAGKHRFRGRYEVILIRPAVERAKPPVAVAEHGLPCLPLTSFPALRPCCARPPARIGGLAICEPRAFRVVELPCDVRKVGVQQVHTFERERAPRFQFGARHAIGERNSRRNDCAHGRGSGL